MAKSPVLLILLALLLTTVGCAATPVNPSFPLSRSDARTALRAMADDPVMPERPIVVVGGILDPGLFAGETANYLRKTFADTAEVMPVGASSESTFEAARTRLIEAVDERWPSDDPQWTVEVDVVAISMGGLVARYAALDKVLPEAGEDELHLPRRLRIARLFTIASPHRGATASGLPTTDARALAMREGSAFINSLNNTNADYPIIAYTRLNDLIVGEHLAAPPGQTAYWVPIHFGEEGHIGCWSDPRILADVARRLRGESPFATGPPAALPTDN